MNDTIGYDLQPLSVLGGVVGWLFARPTSSNAQNGYQLTGNLYGYIKCTIKNGAVTSIFYCTGGKFNYTIEIEFPQTGHHITIEQRFLGVDVFNYLRLSISITGTVPSIAHGSKIEIPDYEEEHVKTGLGMNVHFLL